MRSRITIDLTQVLLVCSLLIYGLSGVFLLLRKQSLAEMTAGVSLIFFALVCVWDPIVLLITWFSKLTKRICNLRFSWVLSIVTVFYLFSSFIHFGQDEGWYMARPKVYGGDEQHLLLMTNSIIEDYDLELSNNYENTKVGSYDAGEAWRFKNLDHHSIFVHKATKQMTHFWNVIDVGGDFSKWDILNAGVWENRHEYYERPHHPPGMSAVFAVFLWPFRGLIIFESITLMLNTIFALLSIICLYEMLIVLGIEDFYCKAGVLAVALATPFYYYSLFLMKEVFLGVILIFSCWLYFFKKNGIWSGVCIAIGCATRYAFPVVVIPMLLYGILKKQWCLTRDFFLTIGILGISYMFYNNHIYGGPFNTGREGEFRGFLSVKGISILFLGAPSIITVVYFLFKKIRIVDLIGRHFNKARQIYFCMGTAVLLVFLFKNSGIRALFVDLDDGIIPVAPFLLIPLLKLFDLRIWRDSRVVGVFGVVFAYSAVYIFVQGHAIMSVYAARKFVPLIPFLAIPLCYWLEDNKSKIISRVFVMAAAYSFILNFVATLARRYFWHMPLDQALLQLVKRWFLV